MRNQSATTMSRMRSVPEKYRQWQLRARDLLEPLSRLMEEGAADIPIEGPASDHDANADRLESFARPFFLYVHWQRSLSNDADEKDRRLEQRMGSWFKDGLLAGTATEEESYWGSSANFHQHSVEMGLLVIGLELSRDWLWNSYQPHEKRRVLDWLETDVGNGHHWNNHMFFGIFVMEFLLKEGRGTPAWRKVIDRWFEELERMHHGDGWFMDGMNQAFDFYNAYAWHYYSLWWNLLYGSADRGRAKRWAGYAAQFLEVYPKFFAASGEHPAFGRSITYRFNATAPFGLAQLAGVSPVEPGLARELCDRNLTFFLQKPIRQGQGCLSLGWHDHFPEMVETYSCGGSVYWAAKAFAPLLLKPEDPFWTDAAQALPAEKGDYCLPLKAPSLIVRSVKGAVELINVGSQIASTNTRFGPYKWGKLSYKTGVGFCIGESPDHYPKDAGLTATHLLLGYVYGRHYTAPAELGEDRMTCLYSLGRKQEPFQVSVETHLHWRGNWQFAFHICSAKRLSRLQHGSYALSEAEADGFEEVEDGPLHAVFASDGRGVALQPILGFDGSGLDARRSEKDGPRRHIQQPYHAALLAIRNDAVGELKLACLSWSGEDRSEAKPWKLREAEAGSWTLEHPALGQWTIADALLPARG